LKEVQQAVHLVCAVQTASQIAELGDEPAQLRRLADATEARLQKVQEEKEKATEALKQEKDEALEQLRVARYSVAAYESEREEFQAMIQKEKSQLQREKEHLLVEQATIKEVVSKACHTVPGLAQEEQNSVKAQVLKLVETIQQLLARITELEAQAVLSTPQEVHDQREETDKNTVVRIRELASECKQMSDRSA
jgi:hypothetical protein